MEIAILFVGIILILIGGFLLEGGEGMLVKEGVFIALLGAAVILSLIIFDIINDEDLKGLEREKTRIQFEKEWDCTIKRRHNELD